ncbi:MbeD family mobilization/exclusion protein, partial [Plesiomonas shigelloides]
RQNATIERLEKNGGKIQFSTCGEKRQLCAKIVENARPYQDGYRILKGYYIMTELEQQLLTAFENLQSQHEKQHKDFVTAYNNLAQLFDTTSKENATLRQQVSHLSEQDNTLSNQLQQFERHYSTKNR